MVVGIVNGLLTLGNTVIDKVIPDPEQRAKAKLELIQLQQQGELKSMETSMSAILAEAQSQDKWTSRARPSFLYVMYAMILFSLPMGFVHAFSPETAQAIAEGLKAYLHALPSEMWTLFGIGYLGYAGARTYDKGKKVG